MSSEDAVCSQPHCIDANKSLCIDGIILQTLAAIVDIHRCQVRAVESTWRLSSQDDGIALVELQLDRASDVTLREVNAIHDELHLRGVPEAVVAKPGELCAERVSNSHDFSIHCYPFQIQVRNAQNSSSWGFINTCKNRKKLNKYLALRG